MGTVSNNLYLYEVVLLFLGAFLFAILCAGLVYYIIKKEDFKNGYIFPPLPLYNQINNAKAYKRN